MLPEEDNLRLLFLYSDEQLGERTLKVELRGASEHSRRFGQCQHLDHVALYEDQLTSLALSPYHFFLQVVHQGHPLSYSQLNRTLFLSWHSFRMLLLEYLGRDLAEVHYLCFAAFAVDIVSGIGEAVAVVLVCEVIINVEVVLCSSAPLLYSEQ